MCVKQGEGFEDQTVSSSHLSGFSLDIFSIKSTIHEPENLDGKGEHVQKDQHQL